MTAWPGYVRKPLEDIGHQWYCYYTKPSHEVPSQKELKLKGFEVYCPLETTINLRGETIKRPLFSRYAFVAFDVAFDPWRRIQRTRGVEALFPIVGERPVRMPFGAIDDLKTREEAGEFGRDLRLPTGYSGPTYQHGDAVRVTDGAFSSFDGVVDLRQEDRFLVLVSIFGRTTPVEMTPAMVAPIADFAREQRSLWGKQRRRA